MNLNTLISLLFNPKAKLRIGVSHTARSDAYVFAVAGKKKDPAVVWAGKEFPLWARLFAPPATCSDLGSAPVYFISSPLKGMKPDAWLDKNEELVIPRGLTSDKAVTGYAIHGDTISCATVTVDARDKFTGIIGKSFPLTSVSMPLWNIAKLYSKTVSGPFILWRIATDGSVLGLMKDGHLDKLLHCYAGADDIRNDPAASKQLIEQFVNSLADGNGEIPVIAYSPEKDFVLPSEPFLSFYKILAMPEIRGVPAFCHEAYANACFNGQDFNFLSHEVQKKAQLADRKMHSLRSLVSISILSVLGLAVLFLGLDGLFTIVDRHYREPMLKLQAETALVKAAERRHGRLAKAVVEKVQFSTQRSHVTQFLSALQNVFPENAWAESIAIALNGKDLYQCDILAATQSSGLIAITLENLSKVAGVSNARLVSSEQGTLRIGGKGMLFKIKCDWRFTE